MNKTYNWGILGPGKIAHKFAQGLSVTKNGRLYAVGSREKLRAEEFGRLYGAVRYYGTYEELVADPEVDIIYISTPHHLHYEMTKLCLEHNKHVLCEKPICINSRQFEELRNMASLKKLFYMDALWTRFLPTITRSLELLPEIGDIQYISADFGFRADYDEHSRLFDPMLGGGSILDIGIYPVFIALLFLGYPDRIVAHTVNGKTGVDHSMGAIFSYKKGAMANLSSTFMTHTSTGAEIAGTKGRINIKPRFFMPSYLEVTTENSGTREIHFETRMNGYEYEAEECMRCLDEGLLESPSLPHSFTSDLMKILDEIRKQGGVRYIWDEW